MSALRALSLPRWPRRPLGPVPRDPAGTAEGPGKGVWPFLGEVSGDTPELDQPVSTLAWNPCGSLDFFFRGVAWTPAIAPPSPVLVLVPTSLRTPSKN